MSVITCAVTDKHDQTCVPRHTAEELSSYRSFFVCFQRSYNQDGISWSAEAAGRQAALWNDKLGSNPAQQS
jgi:hypothetical protein